MIESIIKELQTNHCIAYLGMGVFKEEGLGLPFDSDSFILALNNGRMMSPRLMYEFSRAAMSIEHKRGRIYLEQAVKNIYEKQKQKAQVHKLLASIRPQYLVDTNLDAHLLDIYNDCEHTLVLGKARIGAELKRYVCYSYNVATKMYESVEATENLFTKPVLFKPMGCVKPKCELVVSDADYVDWLTEAMAGFSFPKALKTYRENKKYLFLGQDFKTDTQRMVANEISLGLKGGYYVQENPLHKAEERFIKKHQLEVIPLSLEAFLQEAKQMLTCLA